MLVQSDPSISDIGAPLINLEVPSASRGSGVTVMRNTLCTRLCGFFIEVEGWVDTGLVRVEDSFNAPQGRRCLLREICLLRM